MPITDDDLFGMARTATQLEDFHMTSISSISLRGVLAVVRASRDRLRVLEHSPRSQNGFRYPHPEYLNGKEHLCETLRSLPKLETLSMSLPSVCADLFCRDDAKLRGDMQVRALRLCSHESRCSIQEALGSLQTLL